MFNKMEQKLKKIIRDDYQIMVNCTLECHFTSMILLID